MSNLCQNVFYYINLLHLSKMRIRSIIFYSITTYIEILEDIHLIEYERYIPFDLKSLNTDKIDRK